MRNYHLYVISKYFHHPKRNLIPIKQLLPIPYSPGNHQFAFCLYRFIYSGYFLSVESYNIWLFAAGFFHLESCFLGSSIMYYHWNINSIVWMCVCAQLLSCVWLYVTPWTVTHQTPLSMGFFQQEYWSGLPFPSPGDLPNPEIKPGSLALQADSLPLSHREAHCSDIYFVCLSKGVHFKNLFNVAPLYHNHFR